ncbi:MAG TPA: hypothetical protein VFF64_24995 [Candidatus Eremiobacteraceae bacterium]|nr:hypothetical protein [Candidatus Eremiobacteraceae bacterium]
MADDLAKLTKHEFPALTRELNRFVRTLYQTRIIKKSEIAVTQEKIRTEYFSHMYHLLKTFGDDLTDDALYLMMHIHLAVSLADTLPNGMPNEKRKELVRDLLQFLGTEEFKNAGRNEPAKRSRVTSN